MAEKIRTLIVDDEPLARRNLRLLLEKDPEIEIKSFSARRLDRALVPPPARGGQVRFLNDARLLSRHLSLVPTVINSGDGK